MAVLQASALKAASCLDTAQDGDDVALRRYPRRNAASRRQTSRRGDSHSHEALRRERAQRLQRRHRSALHAQAAHAEGAASKGRPFKAYSWLQAGYPTSLRCTVYCYTFPPISPSIACTGQQHLEHASDWTLSLIETP